MRAQIWIKNGQRLHGVASQGFTNSVPGSGAFILLLFLLPHALLLDARSACACNLGSLCCIRPITPLYHWFLGCLLFLFPNLSLSCVRQLPCLTADGDGAARAHPAAVLPERLRALVLVAPRWLWSCSRAGLARRGTASQLQQEGSCQCSARQAFPLRFHVSHFHWCKAPEGND